MLTHSKDKSHQMGAGQEQGKSEGDGGKIQWKLPEVNRRAVSRGHNELIDEFKITAGDVVSIKG